MTYNGIRQIVTEGSFAYLRSEGTFAGQPFVFHALLRVADGRCVEHWDVMVPRQQPPACTEEESVVVVEMKRRLTGHAELL